MPMIIENALTKALKKREELEREIRKLDQFIHMYHELAGTPPGTNRETVDTGENIARPEETRGTLHQLTDQAGMIRPRGRPADFVRIMEGVLKDVGHPLQRARLVEEVEKRGHSIPSDDKPRYLGTILWRNEETFLNIESRGYWLKALPIPSVSVNELF